VVSPTEAAGSDATGPATPAPESKPVQYDAEKKVRPIPAGSDEKPLKFE
jgi:hypothetical protein